jgi:hypothetical protein
MGPKRALAPAVAAAALLLAAAPARAQGAVVVVADSANAILRVNGGAGDDDIEVTSAGVDDAFVVTGRNGTTVNGQASLTVTGVQRFMFEMRSGSDRVTLTGLRIRSHLTIKCGGGPDYVMINSTQVDGITRVYGGPGDDHFSTNDSAEFVRRLMYYGGDGNDVARIERTWCRNRLYVDMGRGSDSVDLADTDFDDVAEVKTFGGSDDVNVGDCDFEEELRVRMGNGRDHLSIDDCDFEEDADLDGGDGDDDDLDLRGHNHFHEDLDDDNFED